MENKSTKQAPQNINPAASTKVARESRSKINRLVILPALGTDCRATGIVKRTKETRRKSMEAERRKAAVKLSGQRILKLAFRVKPLSNVAIGEKSAFYLWENFLWMLRSCH